jgi:tRNA-2-methylthio-N6-dimethylallyladenosine synthase
LRERKAREPGLVIAVIGCMAEREGLDLARRYPHVDILCGPGELDKLAGMVHNAIVTRLEERRPMAALLGNSTRRSGTLAAAESEDRLELLDLSRAVSDSESTRSAHVRITRGCNKFCTYCVVPNTRGPEVHRKPGNIIDEVRKLADAGVIEITLLGQTINHYLYDHGDGRKTTFADLLYQVHESAPSVSRLRFVTSFPRDFSDAALDAMRDCPRICRYLHVPAQHGSDRILRMMNRGYTAGQYRQFIERARQRMPDVSIASDFIVGFPSETDEDFQATMQLVRDCRFKNSFIFKYSPRPGTAAIERFADDVPEETKRRRNNLLLAEQQRVSEEGNRQMVGRTVEVMVEGKSKLVSRQLAAAGNNGDSSGGLVELGWKNRLVTRASEARTQLVGRTRGDQVVVYDGPESWTGRIMNVLVVDARNLTLFGEAAVAAVADQIS